MEIPWTTIIWLGIAVSVYIYGIYEGRSQGYKKRKAEEEQERREKPAMPPVTVKLDDPGLMRIKNENGYLALDLDGVRTDTTSLTADQRKRLIEMLSLVRPWLEGRAAPAPAAPPPPPPQPKAGTSTQAASTSQSPQPIAREAAAPVTAKTGSAEKDERAAPPAVGIVGQIELILQARLMGTPLEGRGIHLSNSPQGSAHQRMGK